MDIESSAILKSQNIICSICGERITTSNYYQKKKILFVRNAL